MNKKSACPHCGPVPAIHWIEWTDVVVEWLMRPVTKFTNAITRGVTAILRPIGIARTVPFFVACLAFLTRGKVTTEPQEKDSWRARAMWESAKQRGIEIRELWLRGKPSELFYARYGGKIIAFIGLPRPNGLTSPGIEWMDDKGIMNARFAAAGIPVAAGAVCVRDHHACAVFRGLTPPVVVKPNLGSRSRHTTTHITDEPGLVRAFHIAKALSPWVLVIEELSGMVHRATVVGGKVAGVLRREPPYIIGDGARTIRALVAEENKNPARHGPIFHEIPMDDEVATELTRQGLTWESVPDSGHMIVLHQKVGRGQGGTNRDVTPITHPENIALFEKIGAVLEDPLVGIDFIIEDIAKPWHEQPRCGAIECNSLPFIDLHHYPFVGERRDVAGALWDIVLPDSRPAS